MENENVKNELREIVNTPASKLTADQKAKVREYAQAYGVEFTPKGRCSSCYHDAALAIFNKIQESEAEVAAQTDTRRYILRPGVDLWFGNIRVNEATITDALAEEILARGFNPKYFVKCE